jgi:hypothetical protein
MPKLSITLLILLSSFHAFAKDANVLEASDLPKSVIRSFRVDGRGVLPTFEKDFGVEQALNSKSAEASCMAKTGKQLTEWKVETKIIEDFYWTYTISASFECKSPVTSTVLENTAAVVLSKSLKGITAVPVKGVSQKNAKVLCYNFLTDKCDKGVLVGFFNHNVCELTDLNADGKQTKIEDIASDEEVLQNRGATKLTNLLPVYLDNRRDDTPSANNCKPGVWAELKGFSRQAATISCARENENESCKVVGIIDTSKI